MLHTIIIAEAGVNHNGKMDLAKELILKAKEAGVDYVKFQTSQKPENVTSKFADMAKYQVENVGKEEKQLDFLRGFSLQLEDFKLLKQYCDGVGVKFLSTPFDMVSVDFLYGLGMDYMKIPSGEITNLPYLRKIAKLKIPVIMSTGMSSLGDVENAINVLMEYGLRRNQITLLHCNTEYPTPFEDVNLKAMITLRDAFKTDVGYSDHTNGIEVPIAAVAMGALIIEKHFTLDRNLPGPDHKASLEPDELKEMVLRIRNIEKALGNGIKEVSRSEQKNVKIARRSIIAACNIKSGEVYTEKNLVVKRPGSGINPMRWDEVLGKRAKRDFLEDELIEL